MPLDKHKVDAESRRWELFRELVRDPEGVAMLERFITPNGKHRAKPASTEKSVDTAGSRNKPQPRKYGEMRRYALQVLTSTPQTIDQILEQMVAAGFEPMAKSPKASLTRVLDKLETKGQAKKAGKARYGTFTWTK
jgi:hypothetical protein